MSSWCSSREKLRQAAYLRRLPRGATGLATRSRIDSCDIDQFWAFEYHFGCLASLVCRFTRAGLCWWSTMFATTCHAIICHHDDKLYWTCMGRLHIHKSYVHIQLRNEAKISMVSCAK